jgi:regulator of sirC expression with transglutaminase-like and TPR domain
MQSGRVLTHPALARRRFIELAQLPDERLNLTEAALVIALEEYPRIDLSVYLDTLDAWSREIADRIAGSRDAERIIEEINRLLYEEEGFHGEAADYYDPRNAYFNEVLDRHAGLPIALSILYIELSRRAGLPVCGVSLPGRFLVKISGPFGELLVDPFDEGRVLTTIECQKIMDAVFGGGVRLREHHLRSASNREVVAKVLAHLKSLHLAHHKLSAAAAAADRLLILDERDIFELRDRAGLAMQMHEYPEAVEMLSRYLELAPHAEDRRQVREQLDYLRAWLSQN